MESLDVLYEDNHLLVVNKPAGLTTMGDNEQETLYRHAGQYLKQKYNKPGNVFVGIVSRLDRMTSGVIVLARTSKAASRLTSQFANHSGDGAQKMYLALVEGVPDDSQGTLTDWLLKDDQAHRMRCVEPNREQAKRASLQYQVLQSWEEHSLLAVRPLTGRKHQIRVQFAHRGHPIIGDRKYGSARNWVAGTALHSWKLSVLHPTLRKQMTFVAPPPAPWKPSLSKRILMELQQVTWQ